MKGRGREGGYLNIQEKESKEKSEYVEILHATRPHGDDMRSVPNY